MESPRKLDSFAARVALKHFAEHATSLSPSQKGYLTALAHCLADSATGEILRERLLSDVFAGLGTPTANNRVLELREAMVAADGLALGYQLRLISSPERKPSLQRFWLELTGVLPLAPSDATLRSAATVSSSRSVPALAAPPTLELFVSYAADDGVLVHRLISLFQKRLRARTHPLASRITLWTFHKIRGGMEDDTEIQKAIDRCVMGLVMISPMACASPYIQQHEWPRFRRMSDAQAGPPLKPFYTVFVESVDARRHDLGVMCRDQAGVQPQYGHLRRPDPTTGGERMYTWSQCDTPELQGAFVEKLIDEILARLEPFDPNFKGGHGSNSGNPPQPPAPSPPSKGQLHSHRAHEAHDHRNVPTRGKRMDDAQPRTDRRAQEGSAQPLDTADNAQADAVSTVQPQAVQELLELWAKDTGPKAEPFGALFGEFGTGKSWNTQLLAKHLIHQRHTGDAKAPLPIYFDFFSAMGEHNALVRDASVP